jgi:hypothetical protein
MTKAKQQPEEQPAPPAAIANLALWRELGITNPDYTKQFDRGGFSGTMIDPTWRMLRMTEVFGPVGKGWGWEELDCRIENGCVFIKVRAWYVPPGGGGEVLYTGPQWGGTELNAKRKTGVVANDEAFKMSSTDALGKCLLSIGMAADVYLGLFDDAKYREVAERVYDQKEREKREARKAGNGTVIEGTAIEHRPDPGVGADVVLADDFPGEHVETDEEWAAGQVQFFASCAEGVDIDDQEAVREAAMRIKRGWAAILDRAKKLMGAGKQSLAQELAQAYQDALMSLRAPANRQAAE